MLNSDDMNGTQSIVGYYSTSTPPPPLPEVLARVCIEDIEILLVSSQLRWLGHVLRMEGDRPVKYLLYGEFNEGIRRPKQGYKDKSKSALKCGNVLEHWKSKVENQTEWR